MVTPLHIAVCKLIQQVLIISFAQHIALSKRTHQTDNHSPKCQAIHNMHIAQLVKNKNSYVAYKEEE